MSFRPRRALVGLVTVAAALASLPATALAAGETLNVSPSNPQAGGNPTVTVTLGFNPGSGDTPKTVATSLAPGLLNNLGANPSCLQGSPQHTSACQIGSGSVTASGPSEAGSLYLVPPHGSDLAGVEFVGTTPLALTQYIGVTLNPSAPGGLNLTATLPNAGVQITQFVASFNPTLNGHPFTRLPTSCAPATSTMSVTYYNSTPAGSATSSFTPSGCGSVPYSPQLTASITKDKSGNGATLVFTVKQAANEAASKTIALNLPNGLAPNALADAACLTGTGPGCTVGTATATSPLVPTPVTGTVTLSGTLGAPKLTITFPAPLGITLTGTINLASSSVTFADVPDVPLTSLTQTITGPNGQKAFTTDCKPAHVTGSFTGQNGVVKTVDAPVTFVGCAAKPTVSGSTSGLASGHPGLKFTVTRGQGAPNIATVAVGVPGGLRFSHAAIVTHRTCTIKGKKKSCTTTTLIKGLGISGARAKSVAIRGGRLVITLTKPAGRFTIIAVGPLVSETKSLQTKVKKHRVKSLKFSLKVTDATKAATTVSLSLRAH